jgi:hypothetical protein
LIAVALTMSVSLTPRAHAQGDDSVKILKAMSDYMASQKTLSLTCAHFAPDRYLGFARTMLDNEVMM